MLEEINISKSLIKKVVTFLNKYVDNPHVICGYTKYTDFINVIIQIWTLDALTLGRNIDSISEYIYSNTDFKLFEEKLQEKINKGLEQLKENQL